MAQHQAPGYDREEASFGSRETTLAAAFGFAPQRVFNAMEQAAERQGLRILMASAANGLLVARPRTSLLNLGRRVTVTFSRAGEESTTVRARYTHGLVSFEDRYARLALLNDLFRSALLQLEAGQAAREAIRPGPDAPEPAPPAPEPVAPAPEPAAAQPAPEPPAEAPAPPPAYPTLNELRARARAEAMARSGLPGAASGAEEFLSEEPEGFRLPARFKARRIFWFALGMALAVVVMILLSLSTR